MPRPPKKAHLDAEALRRFGREVPQTIAEFYSLLAILKSFGICTAYEQLEHPEITPEACLARASRSLDLLAFHGDKWLYEEWLYPALERLALRRGQVRFLLSHTIEQKTVARCIEVMSRFPELFYVRTYSNPSTFRVIIIDESRMLLGHYGYEVIERDGTNAKGWKSPQLFIEDNHNWSLLIPFRQVFRNIWETASELRVLQEPATSTVRREFHPQ